MNLDEPSEAGAWPESLTLNSINVVSQNDLHMLQATREVLSDMLHRVTAARLRGVEFGDLSLVDPVPELPVFVQSCSGDTTESAPNGKTSNQTVVVPKDDGSASHRDRMTFARACWRDKIESLRARQDYSVYMDLLADRVRLEIHGVLSILSDRLGFSILGSREFLASYR